MWFIWRRTGGAYSPWVAIESATTESGAREVLTLCRAPGEYVVSPTRPGKRPPAIDHAVRGKPYREPTSSPKDTASGPRIYRAFGRE